MGPFTKANLDLAKGRITYRGDEAARVIAAYAFAEEPAPVERRLHHLGLTRRVYPYITYDRAPADRDRPGIDDVLAAATEGVGLSRPAQRSAIGALEQAPRFALPQAGLGDFTNWDPSFLTDLRRSRAPHLDNLVDLIELLAGVNGVSFASATYIAHRAFPLHAPIVDSHTTAAYEEKGFGCWLPMWEDLTFNAADFDQLEHWFNAFSLMGHHEPLFRLRLLDILLRFPDEGDDAWHEGRTSPAPSLRPSPRRHSRRDALAQAEEIARRC